MVEILFLLAEGVISFFCHSSDGDDATSDPRERQVSGLLTAVLLFLGLFAAIGAFFYFRG